MIYSADGRQLRPAMGFVGQWLAVRKVKDSPVDAVSGTTAPPAEEAIEIAEDPKR